MLALPIVEPAALLSSTQLTKQDVFFTDSSDVSVASLASVKTVSVLPSVVALSPPDSAEFVSAVASLVSGSAVPAPSSANAKGTMLKTNIAKTNNDIIFFIFLPPFLDLFLIIIVHFCFCASNSMINIAYKYTFFGENFKLKKKL
jgi:hypothetical protein